MGPSQVGLVLGHLLASVGFRRANNNRLPRSPPGGQIVSTKWSISNLPTRATHYCRRRKRATDQLSSARLSFKRITTACCGRQGRQRWLSLGVEASREIFIHCSATIKSAQQPLRDRSERAKVIAVAVVVDDDVVVVAIAPRQTKTSCAGSGTKGRPSPRSPSASVLSADRYEMGSFESIQLVPRLMVAQSWSADDGAATIWIIASPP